MCPSILQQLIIRDRQRGAQRLRLRKKINILLWTETGK